MTSTEWLNELEKKVKANKGFCAKLQLATDKTSLLSQTAALKMTLEDRLKDLEKCINTIKEKKV